MLPVDAFEDVLATVSAIENDGRAFSKRPRGGDDPARDLAWEEVPDDGLALTRLDERTVVHDEQDPVVQVVGDGPSMMEAAAGHQDDLDTFLDSVQDCPPVDGRHVPFVVQKCSVEVDRNHTDGHHTSVAGNWELARTIDDLSEVRRGSLRKPTNSRDDLD